MLIVGTAGHIDHGKTALIGALTGMDTDRLAEEKRRGISIDLGFAHLTAPDGRQISFIDVPGHERFIKNMLAGVGGIGAVLLVVAADEGVKPQTREHFEICRLLQVPAGLIAVSKIDAASPEQIAATRAGISALVRGSFLENAPLLPVSARTGEGVPSLRGTLLELNRVQQDRSSEGIVRLNIDRAFAAKGFGTVVTGTLLGGVLRVGDAVQVHPVAKQAKVRSLQVHGKAVDLAKAGERTAVNLNGVDHSEIQRGYVLTHRNELSATSLIDVSIEWLDIAQIAAGREQFLLHAGTSEIVAHLKMMGKEHARIWLNEPALVLPGDHLILRRPSPAETVAGATVLDAFPPRRLHRLKLQERLAKLQGSSWPSRLALLVDESASGRHLPDLVKRTGLPVPVLRQYIGTSEKLVFIEGDQRVLSLASLHASRKTVLEWLREFHSQNPSAPGAPIGQVRALLDAGMVQAVFDGFLDVRIAGELVALASHKAQANPEQMKMLRAIEQVFRAAGSQPPTPAALLQQAGSDGVKGRPFLEALIKAQRLVRVSDEIVFHVDVILEIRRLLSSQKGLRFSIPEFKEWTQVSRKYAVPLLEYLDRQRVTRRDGDVRLIL